MEFQSEKSDCNLFTLAGDEAFKQIDLKGGVLKLKFDKNDDWKTVCDKKLDDNQWHTISVICEEKKLVQVAVDGNEFEVKTGERKVYKFNSIGSG